MTLSPFIQIHLIALSLLKTLSEICKLGGKHFLVLQTHFDNCLFQMGADQSKDSSLSEAPPSVQTSDSYENVVMNPESGFHTEDRKDPAIWPPIEVFNNGAAELADVGNDVPNNPCSDVPFVLSPVLCVQLGLCRSSNQVRNVDFTNINLNKYDYDFTLERSIVAN